MKDAIKEFQEEFTKLVEILHHIPLKYKQHMCVNKQLLKCEIMLARISARGVELISILDAMVKEKEKDKEVKKKHG